MKRYQTSHGRDTVEIKHFSITVNGTEIEAHNVAPFLLRAKWSYEPEIRQTWEEPGCPEWFHFDGLYAYETSLFVTECGVVVTISPSVDLLQILDDRQLSIVQEAVMEEWKRYAELGICDCVCGL